MLRALETVKNCLELQDREDDDQPDEDQQIEVLEPVRSCLQQRLRGLSGGLVEESSSGAGPWACS